MKKSATAILAFAAALSFLPACTPATTSVVFDSSKAITVVSREDGSGTRGAFIELFGILYNGNDGSKKDLTTKEAIIAKQTDVMMTNISADPYAIGYISLGSLNDTIKALDIDGTPASAQNVKNRTYTIARPFIIATKPLPSPLARDFIDFILSADGQDVVAKSYTPIADSPPPYSPSPLSGKIVVAGSSSVTPIMEKLKEAYTTLNPYASIEIQLSDSSAGITAAIDGTCDIAMSSRDLKDGELPLLSPSPIALDGIAVIVNPKNPIASLSKDQVNRIFTGEIPNWNGVIYE